MLQQRKMPSCSPNEHQRSPQSASAPSMGGNRKMLLCLPNEHQRSPQSASAPSMGGNFEKRRATKSDRPPTCDPRVRACAKGDNRAATDFIRYKCTRGADIDQVQPRSPRPHFQFDAPHTPEPKSKDTFTQPRVGGLTALTSWSGSTSASASHCKLGSVV